MFRLFRFLRHYIGMILVVFALVFGQSMANLYLPTLLADIINNGIVKNDQTYILQQGGIMLLVTFGGALAAIGAAYFAAHVAVGFGRDVRQKLFTHVSKFSLHEFDKVGTASMITRTTNDTNQVQTVLLIMLSMLISAPMMAIGGIILAMQQDATLTWTLAAAIPVLVIVILLVMTKAIPLFQIMQVKIDKVNLVLDEGLTGVRVIRAFGREPHEERRFDLANLDLTDTAISVYRLTAILFPFMMLILNLTTVAIFWFGSNLINTGDMQVGALIAFLQYAMQILFAFLMLSMMFIFLPRAAASAKRINEVLDIKPEITDAATTREAASEQGMVEFRDVTFSYPGAEEPALSHISFTARPGQVTAIIGGTGAGKSSLVTLIPRFYDVDSGAVLVDGVDVREQAQEALRAKIGFVPQRAVLFSGTIEENIRYGKGDATEDEIRHAAEIAQATEFIDEMPQGMRTEIAQGGTNVSGGQKQRLSIARALVRRPEIYIFDDTFSALDYTTDANLRAALKGETGDATVVIVAQRVSTILEADQILVLDEGKVAGIGTHHQLMETNEVYREIVLSQLSLEEVA
ncbi:MAG TPA: ABC transporter ATP-binding protein [Ktedonobacterales bacterium]|jgi:ATP-binding cassette subfamily B protein|nr:ABC transporter ATP-binding protein [Ktedonobacterales bacterium]HEX5569878.1 ABC transporter ATP-binding protein [Ktedonobacterales bacterium]